MTDLDVTRRNEKPRLLRENERVRLEEFIDSIGYSARYGKHTVEKGWSADMVQIFRLGI